MPEFDVQRKRTRINVFKIGKIYVFKHFFDDKEIFKGLVDLVKIGKDKKYAGILRNSVDFRETKDARIFIMKDMAAVEEAISLGAEKY